MDKIKIYDRAEIWETAAICNPRFMGMVISIPDGHGSCDVKAVGHFGGGFSMQAELNALLSAIDGAEGFARVGGFEPQTGRGGARALGLTLPGGVQLILRYEPFSNGGRVSFGSCINAACMAPGLIDSIGKMLESVEPQAVPLAA